MSASIGKRGMKREKAIAQGPRDKGRHCPFSRPSFADEQNYGKITTRLKAFKHVTLPRDKKSWYMKWEKITFNTKGKGLGSKRNQFCSVARSCPTLCDPMDYSTPGFPVHHQLLELAQTHVQ